MIQKFSNQKESEKKKKKVHTFGNTPLEPATTDILVTNRIDTLISDHGVRIALHDQK